MKYPLILLFAAANFAPLSEAAVIQSSFIWGQFGDGGGPSHEVEGEPSFTAAQYFQYGGRTIVLGGPDEELLDLVLTFSRNPGQPELWRESNLLGSLPKVNHGTLISSTTDSLGSLRQTWQVEWMVGYESNADSIFAYYAYETRNLVEVVPIHGTATLTAITSAGQYDLASYSFIYHGITEPIPEPSPAVLSLLAGGLLLYRRRR